MEASVRRKGEYLIVSITGRLELEPVEIFRQHCFNHLRNEKFIFNLSGLSFVGSTGIKSFLKTLTDLEKMMDGPLRMHSVSSEFERIFASHLEEGVRFYETEFLAIQSFLEPIRTSETVNSVSKIVNTQSGNPEPNVPSLKVQVQAGPDGQSVTTVVTESSLKPSTITPRDTENKESSSQGMNMESMEQLFSGQMPEDFD